MICIQTMFQYASRFALGFADDVQTSEISEALDRSMLSGLEETVSRATDAFERFDYARALEIAERSFWNWTDDYLELVKTRAYGETPGATSAHAALQLALGVYLRLFAPFLPFVTEEVWSWWQDGSIHRSSWPSHDEFSGLTGDAGVMQITSEVLTAVRRTKSDAQASMRAGIDHISVTADGDSLALLKQAEPDLLAAARSGAIHYSEGEFSVEPVLAEVSSS